MTTPYAHYFAVGTSLANMQNVESIVEVPPTYLDTGRIPLVGAEQRRVGSGRMRSDGFIQTEGITFDGLTRSEYRALLQLILGGYFVNSRLVYVSWVDDLGFYSPFRAWIDRPSGIRDFTPDRMRPTIFPLRDLILQSVIKTGNYTVTPSDRLIYVDTTSGDVTLALQAASTFTPYTAYRFVKTTAANQVIIDGNSSETIDGGATLTLIDKNSQAQIVSNGGSAWSSISDES